MVSFASEMEISCRFANSFIDAEKEWTNWRFYLENQVEKAALFSSSLCYSIFFCKIAASVTRASIVVVVTVNNNEVTKFIAMYYTINTYDIANPWRCYVMLFPFKDATPFNRAYSRYVLPDGRKTGSCHRHGWVSSSRPSQHGRLSTTDSGLIFGDSRLSRGRSHNRDDLKTEKQQPIYTTRSSTLTRNKQAINWWTLHQDSLDFFI